MIIKLRAILLFMVLSLFISVEVLASFDEIDLTCSTGSKNNKITTNRNSTSSKVNISNMVASIKANLEFLDNFFIMATTSTTVAEESNTETFTYQGDIIQQGGVSFGEKSLEIYGGVDLFSLFNPFLGFSITESKLKRSINSNDSRVMIGEQTMNDYDWIVGLKGRYDFNDYTSIGYLLKYKASSSLSNVEYNQVEFDDSDVSNISSEVFLKYWLPNEMLEIGIHLVGGQYLNDEKTEKEELLPDTDIKFVGAFVSFKINL